MKKKFAVTFLSLFGLLLSSCDFINSIFKGKDKEVALQSIAVETLPTKTTYFEGETFDPNGLCIIATYSTSDGENAQVRSVSYLGNENKFIFSVSLDTPLKPLDNEIKVTYYEKSTSFDITVNRLPTVEMISVKNLPKTTYFEGATFDPSGLEIEAKYSNGETKLVSYNENKDDFTFSISLDKLLETSDHTIELIYKEKTASFDIDVTEVSKIEKTKLSYTYDDYTKNNAYNIDNCPLQGSPKLLIIPVWFNDSNNFIIESKKEEVRNDIEKAYIGTSEETNWNSVKSYYETESQNKIKLSATVTEWYEIDNSYTEYAPESKVDLTMSLVKKASDNYFSNHSTDKRKNYDSNGDGYLDGVMLIYAAPDYDSLGNDSYKNLWAYCYWTGAISSKTNPSANAFFWASYDFLYGSNAKEKTGSSYGRGFTQNGITIDTHCFIHEMGHVFGLEDYYDYSSFGYCPAGGFSMQDMNVGGHDPYSVMAYGWADPYIPNDSMTISIGDFQSTHDVILLANHSISDSPFDEYLLLEYYTPTGLNEHDSKYTYRYVYPHGPSKGGIRLWHVDARLYSYNQGQMTTNPTDGGVYHALSNSYDSNHGSILGEEYYNYNILQLIRNDTYATYTPRDSLVETDLFKAGNTFDMQTYSSQFVNGSKMNDNNPLGWSFKVEYTNESKAIITLTKL